MKRTIDVLLGEKLQVGTLRYDLQGRRENAAFEYAAGWLEDPARFSLGPTLPLQAGPQFSEDVGPDMTIDALMSVIAYFRITKARAGEILSQVVKSVESWRTTGKSIGMSAEELEPFIDAFEHTERNAAMKLI